MSLFGQSSGGSVFGQNSSQPQQSSLFGSAQPQTQQSGNLFGSTAPQTQQSSGLFGSASNQTQAPSLFGNTPAQTQQQQSSSIFNKPANPTQNVTQPGSSLFGSTTTQPTKPTPSLFPNQSQNQPQQPQMSLFGSSSNNAAPVQPAQSGSLFSSSSSKLPALGQAQQQQQSIPGVRIDVSQLRGTTRFVDLHEEIQKQIEQIDTFIQQQVSFKEQCDAMMPAHGANVQSVPEDVKLLKGLIEGVEASTEGNAHAVGQMKDSVNKDADDARLSFQAIENLKLPNYFHYSGSFAAGGAPRGAGSRDDNDNASDLISYFLNAASGMSSTLSVYEENIAEIESHLKLVEANAISKSQRTMLRRGKEGSENRSEDQVRELAAVLREFETGIMGVAGRVGQLRESMQELSLKMYK